MKPTTKEPGRFSLSAIFRAVDAFSAPVATMEARLAGFTKTASTGFVKRARKKAKRKAKGRRRG